MLYVSIEILSKFFLIIFLEKKQEYIEINYERSNDAVLSWSWKGKKGYVSIEMLLKLFQDNLFEEISDTMTRRN